MIGWIALLLAISVVSRSAGSQQPADSALAQIERRASAGDRAAARAMADSLLAALSPASDQYAEALYWRAFTAPSAAEAERDYLRLGVEYPLSRRAAVALLTLAQLEYARGDRRAAQRHFERLLLDHPSGTHVAKASYWSGRLALDDGDVKRGCAALTTARSNATSDDVELLNQIQYHLSRCTFAVSDSAPPAVDSTATPRATREFSIQAAAFETRREATALAEKLKGQGLEARVMGSRAPFRVRIGWYATREEATAALARVRRTSPGAIIVGAEPR
jgi:cell division septation protein DedD